MAEEGTRGERIVAEIRREDITSEKLINIFDEWSANYDQDVVQLGYGGYHPPVEKLCQLYPTGTRGHVRILDVAAGTGLLGFELKKSGFVHIDCLDASKNMMDEARKRDVYQNYFIEFLTENPLDIKQDTYDVVVGSGIFSTAHVPYKAIFEMIRLTKPGGHVVLSMGEYVMSQPEYLDMGPTMEKLEKEGKWKLLEKTVFPGFIQGANGAVHVFQIQ